MSILYPTYRGLIGRSIISTHLMDLWATKLLSFHSTNMKGTQANVPGVPASGKATIRGCFHYCGDHMETYSELPWMVLAEYSSSCSQWKKIHHQHHFRNTLGQIEEGIKEKGKTKHVWDWSNQDPWKRKGTEPSLILQGLDHWHSRIEL